MARTKRPTPNANDVIGYADSGLGLAAQRAAIETEAARRGWNLLAIHEDAGYSAKKLDGRPAMTEALRALDNGQAAALVVAKLDRATRSTLDAANLLERASRGGWALVALDLGVDMTTPAGELVASVMAGVAQWERRTIGARTREALAAKKAQGVTLGRPVNVPAGLVDRIRTDHRNGLGFSAIARALNDEHVPTAQGGTKWYPSTVRAVVLATYQGAEAA
jgi:DNA invertase Pin-like site-specific DNA recombinase